MKNPWLELPGPDSVPAGTSDAVEALLAAAARPVPPPSSDPAAVSGLSGRPVVLGYVGAVELSAADRVAHTAKIRQFAEGRYMLRWIYVDVPEAPGAEWLNLHAGLSYHQPYRVVVTTLDHLAGPASIGQTKHDLLIALGITVQVVFP